MSSDSFSLYGLFLFIFIYLAPQSFQMDFKNKKENKKLFQFHFFRFLLLVYHKQSDNNERKKVFSDESSSTDQSEKCFLMTAHS